MRHAFLILLVAVTPLLSSAQEVGGLDDRASARAAVHATRTLQDRVAGGKDFAAGTTYTWTFSPTLDGPAVTVGAGATLQFDAPTAAESGWYQVSIEEPGQNPLLSDPVQLSVGVDTALPLGGAVQGMAAVVMLALGGAGLWARRPRRG